MFFLFLILLSFLRQKEPALSLSLPLLYFYLASPKSQAGLVSFDLALCIVKAEEKRSALSGWSCACYQYSVVCLSVYSMAIFVYVLTIAGAIKLFRYVNKHLCLCPNSSVSFNRCVGIPRLQNAVSLRAESFILNS